MVMLVTPYYWRLSASTSTDTRPTRYNYVTSSSDNYVTSSSGVITWTSSSTATFTVWGGGDGVTFTDDWIHLGYIAETDLAEGREERKRERERARTEAAAKREREKAERDKAEATAAKLLLSLLPEDQKEPYRLTGVFEVIGSRGTRYRIRRGVAGNIDWLDADGKVGGSLCCHPPTAGDAWVPTSDVMVAQMLALRTDEADFVRVANLSAGRPVPRPALRRRVAELCGQNQS